MPATTITKRSVDAAKPGERDAFLWDRELRGFGLKVTPAGAKVYLVQYRVGGRGTPTRRFTIGRHGAPWTPDQARRKAKEVLGEVAAGRDPAEEKRAKRSSASLGDRFEMLASQFLAHGRTKRGRELRPATITEYRRGLLTYAKPLHARVVTNIERAAVTELIEDVASQRGVPSAMRTRAALSRFFGWLMARGKVDNNPVAGTEGYDTPRGKRVLEDSELRLIWTATQGRSAFNTIVRLILWTGTRRAEPGGMRRSEFRRVVTKGSAGEVVFDGEVWVVPGNRTKNHRDLALPLPWQALDELDRWPRVEGRHLLFSRGKHGFSGWSKAKASLDDRISRRNAARRLGRMLSKGEEPIEADRMSKWILHDLRRTVETRMAGLGIRKEIVNRVLNHAAGPITETYDLHGYLPEKRDALQSWADELEAIVSQPDQGNVVPMTARA